MRITAIAIAAVLTLVMGGCGKGQKDPGAGSGSAAQPLPPAPIACPPGSLPGPTGACVVVVTPAQITAVAAQKTRIDELAGLLDKLDALAAPIDLLNGIRQQDAWKQFSASSDKLKVVDTIVQTLADSVAQLRAFRGNLGELSSRLGNLRAELDKLIAGTGAATSLDDARAKISAQVRELITPFAQETGKTIQTAIAPLVDQLADVGDLVRGACAMAKLSGGSDQLKSLCGQVGGVFTQAMTFLDGIKARPAALFSELTNLLVGQLDQLLDAGAKAAIAAAQAQVDAALKAPLKPPMGSADGSGSGSGSGT